MSLEVGSRHGTGTLAGILLPCERGLNTTTSSRHWLHWRAPHCAVACEQTRRNRLRLEEHFECSCKARAWSHACGLAAAAWRAAMCGRKRGVSLGGYCRLWQAGAHSHAKGDLVRGLAWSGQADARKERCTHAESSDGRAKCGARSVQWPACLTGEYHTCGVCISLSTAC